MRRVLLCLLILMTTSSCTLLLAARGARVDPRTSFPEARPFESSQSLPGDPPAATADVRGAWYFRETQASAARDPIFGNVAQPFHAIWIWLRDDGTYDLVYQAYFGTRAVTDPRRSGIDVRESGRFSIAGGSLSLEPVTTRAVEITRGNRERSMLDNEPRDYLAGVDGGYLYLAGPCARYQVEPICRESTDVWISLRSVSVRSPDDVPEL
ncbi:MAG TPA: hypothetical protein VF339_03920 [Gammaproteobacteria bacterium]